MRDLKRIALTLELIRQIWEKYPDWRLGQLLTNVFSPFENTPWFIEDDILIEALKNFLRDKK